MLAFCARFFCLEIASRPPKPDGTKRGDDESAVANGTGGNLVGDAGSTTASINTTTSLKLLPLLSTHSLVRTESGPLERNSAGVIVQHSPKRINELEVEMLREVEASAGKDRCDTTTSASISVKGHVIDPTSSDSVGGNGDVSSPTCSASTSRLVSKNDIEPVSFNRQLAIDESESPQASTENETGEGGCAEEGGCGIETRKAKSKRGRHKRRAAIELPSSLVAKAPRIGGVPDGYMWSNNKPPKLIRIPARVRGSKGSWDPSSVGPLFDISRDPENRCRMFINGEEVDEREDSLKCYNH